MIQTTYQLHSSELNENFMAALKQLFSDKNIKIVVTELDETSYLSASAANQQHLSNVIHDIEMGKNLVTVVGAAAQKGQ